MAKRMLVSEEMARDAVQQSMMKLWDKRRQLSRCTNIKAFVFRVVKNVCLDELKRKKAAGFDDYVAFNEKTAEHNSDFENSEAVSIVKLIVEKLPANQAEVIQMRDIDGLEFDEIADVLDTDVAYIRVLLSRARKTVREKLEKIYKYEAKQKI
ncbi:MAG: RNA polymerase sigma factor [Prolixibacteraceae bacterium]|nr:RNA polymerase sigma factor [Prolixibacteraceae bacterium]